MNNIIMDRSGIAVFTDLIDANSHKHWMLQLFFSFDGDLNISVEDKEIYCKCIVVNSNVRHSFTTGDLPHFTMLIDAASALAQEIQDRFLKGKNYYIFENEAVKALQQSFHIPEQINEVHYKEFVSLLFQAIDIQANQDLIFDERIKEVLEKLEDCDCSEHSLRVIADHVALSQSRLSHLFKIQTGVPLKSYILLHQIQRAFLEYFNTGNITAAAMNAGFDSPSHFAYTSKKMTGMSATASTKDSVFLKVSVL